MRTKILAAILCLVSPIAHAQCDERPSWAEQQTELVNNEIAAYEEGRIAGQYQLRLQQDQGWTGYGSGLIPTRH